MLENIIQGLTRVVGPLAAGGLLAAVGTRGGLLVLVGMGVGGMLLVMAMHTRSRAPVAPGGIHNSWVQMREGLQYLRRQPRILGVVLITAIMNAWTFPFMGLLPVFARDVLGQGPLGLGILGAASGAGALLGLVAVNLSRTWCSKEWLFGGGSALACLGVVGFACSSSFEWSVGLMLLSGIGQAGFSVMQSAITLVEASDEMRSRAMAAVVLAIGAAPFGQLQSGAMANAWGAPLACGTLAGLAMVATLGTMLLLPGFARPKAQH